MDDLWTRINRRNDQQRYQDGPDVRPIPTFIERPVREAVLNAVNHRNYQLGGNIFVRQHARRLEIDSPGGFPPGITVANILDRQNPHHRRVAELLTRCGLVERSGQGMNLIYEEQTKDSKPAPDWQGTDAYQVGLTLHGTVQDRGFVRFVEQVTQEARGRREVIGTHDWLVLSQAFRGGRLDWKQEERAARLADLGLIERAKGRTYLLSRRYAEFVGDRAAYTRKKGLDRGRCLGLLLSHLKMNSTTGCRLDELCRVVPSLPTTHVRSLLRSLQRGGRAHPAGHSAEARWWPGPSPAGLPSDAPE